MVRVLKVESGRVNEAGGRWFGQYSVTLLDYVQQTGAGGLERVIVTANSIQVVLRHRLLPRQKNVDISAP